MTATEYRSLIREVPDFPKPGILFYDITTLLKDAAAYREAIDLMVDAPTSVTEQQLKELHIRVALKS